MGRARSRAVGGDTVFLEYLELVVLGSDPVQAYRAIIPPMRARVVPVKIS